MKHGFLTVAAAIMQRRLVRASRKAAGKTMAIAAAGYLAVMSLLAAFGFVLAALWAYARPFAGAIGTPLLLAALCTVLALVFVLVITTSLRKPKRTRYDTGQTEGALALEAQNLIAKQKLPILLAVALMGLVAGSQKR